MRSIGIQDRNGELSMMAEEVRVALRPYGYGGGNGRECAALLRALAELVERQDVTAAPCRRSRLPH